MENLISEFLRVLGLRVEYTLETSTRHMWAFPIGAKTYHLSYWVDARDGAMCHVRFFPRDMDEPLRSLKTDIQNGALLVITFIEKEVTARRGG